MENREQERLNTLEKLSKLEPLYQGYRFFILKEEDLSDIYGKLQSYISQFEKKQ